MLRTTITATLLMLILAACATTLETVYVPAENAGWKLGYGSDQRSATIKEFIPTNETISNWSKIFTIQFLEGTRDTPSIVMKNLQSRMMSRCPAVQWNVLAQDAASVTYEWSIAGCAGQPDQNEIARLLKGNDGVHRIAYVRKASKLTVAEREAWLKAFSDAYVEKGGKRVVAP